MFVQQEKGLVGDLIDWLACFLYVSNIRESKFAWNGYGIEMIFSTSGAAALLPLVPLEMQKTELELDFM